MEPIQDEDGKIIGYRVRIKGAKKPEPLPGKDHNCWDFPRPYEFFEDGRRYHGWECGRCGEFLQAG